MLNNYLLVALRSLQRRKAYSVINIGGLALGLGCAILIFLSVRFDYSYDRFHSDSDRIFRVLSIDRALGVSAQRVGVTIPALGPAMEAELPEVEMAVRASGWPRTLVTHEDRGIYSESALQAEPRFFELFDFPLLEGDAGHVLTEPQTIVLTRSFAERLFGESASPVGQTVRIGSNEFRVTGLAEDVPANSHLNFDLVASLVPTSEQLTAQLESWNSIGWITYVRLTSPEAAPGIDDRIEEILRRNEVVEAWSATVQPLREIHLRSTDVLFDNNEGKSDIAYIYGLSLFALFILAIAVFNFMNLATARAAERAREVGVRKVVGATRGQLVAQHLGESAVMTALAFVLAAVGVGAILHYAGDIFGRNLSVGHLVEPQVIVAMIALGIGVAVLAGAYPAFVLSGFRPISVLKGGFRHGGHGEALRRTLVVTQFTAASVLIAGALIVSGQLDYIMSRHPGYDRAQVVILDIPNQALQERAPALIERLEGIPAVTSVARANSVPGRGLGRAGVIPEGHPEEDTWIVSVMSIDDRYLETLGMSLEAGRNFSAEYGSETAESVLINEAAARSLGWREPVGMRITVGGAQREVVGIVRDFHFVTMRQPIEPILFLYNVGGRPTISLRLEGTEMNAGLAQIEEAWSAVNPEYPFEYSFLDDEFAQTYAEERTFSRLARGFTLVSIVIACLGLFGLAAFATEQRRQEIGVRKVMGASVPNIMGLFLRQVVALVFVALLIATPIAWMALQNWLDGFAYRIDLAPGVFLLTGLVVLLVAALTVGYQALKAASVDPIRSLRYE
jgi:putative ABC transport system permease protein